MKRLLLPLQAALTLGVLAVVARRVDVHAAAASVRHASPAWLTFALVMNLLAVSLSARLWATLMPERKSGYAKLWHLYVMGLFYNNLGLGTVLGDGFRYAQLRRDGEDASRSAASVLGERLLSGVALLALAALGSLYFVPSRPLVTAAVWAAVLAALFVGAVATRMLPRVSRVPLPARLRREAAGVRDAARDLARRRPTVVAGFAWACGVQCCTILATFCLVRALGVGIQPLACVAVVPVIALAVLLPISIQGIGVREATYILLFGFVGVTREQALSAAMLSYLTTLAITAIGGVFALSSMYSRGGARSATQAPSPAGLAQPE